MISKREAAQRLLARWLDEVASGEATMPLREMRRSKRSKDQAARQIVKFGEAVASAWRSYGNAEVWAGTCWCICRP